MPASFPVEQQETQIYRDCPVMLKFKYLGQKRISEGNPRETMRQAPHSNLLEVGNLRRPRVAVCSFLSSQTLETSGACLLVSSGAGGEAKLAGEASPQGQGVLHSAPVQVSVETFSQRLRPLHLGNPCALLCTQSESLEHLAEAGLGGRAGLAGGGV